MRTLAVNLHVQQARRADDDFLEICGHVIIEPFAHGKAREQRRGEQSAARGRADKREARQVQPHAARVRPLVNDDIEFEILHRRVHRQQPEPNHATPDPGTPSQQRREPIN